MQELIDRIAAEARPRAAEGKVADYIPALARVDPGRFALVLRSADGQEWVAGEADAPFSIQSISKLFTLALAMEWLEPDGPDGLWSRVGREPSGMRFNSLIQLETEAGIPRNPFINAGAIVVTDALMTHRWNLETAFRAQMRLLAGNPELHYDAEVAASERMHGDLNRAIAYVLRAYGNLRQDPQAVTDTYFRACSLAISARDLARAAGFLVSPQGEGACAAGHHARWLRAIMRTCGLYDQSGEFAFRVGLPGKSGVGGGIVAVQPPGMSAALPQGFVAVAWSPPLDRFGNSVAAQAALEALAGALE
ncbi:glutaminase [Paralimibaculum aggregatum]|uniref:Glutaminase n=1 Tax=Paralimibaculum aggregatum TaxID=3036245 RepID=A0ABQ6LLL6_9RHOB|nr:glutaminase A [Limibaculum sp. NKW23]GMG84094.1 glutaminase [Limibaculum sp. NKW23]